MTNDKLQHIGPIEILLEDGEYFYTEVCREGDKLITGTFTNNSFLRDDDRFEVDLDDHYGSLQEGLQELYQNIFDYCWLTPA
jgi:hypothetical protein